MRKNIGWQDKDEDGKFEIRVVFGGTEQIQWRRVAGRGERWEPLEPTRAHWDVLLEKVRARYVRRQAPYKDLQLVERLAARAPSPPAPIA
jgi:hypothetical protein